jgi:glycosyltransferase involved in cell wall biosynthesis
MIRLGLVIRSLESGGAEVFLSRLVRYLDRTVFEIQVIVLVTNAEQQLKSNFLEQGIEPIFCPYQKNDPRILFWLGNLARKLDLIHSFLWRCDAVCALTVTLCGLENLIISERGDRTGVYSSFSRSLYDRYITLRVARGAVANSHHGAGVLKQLGMPEDRIQVIPNGLDVNKLRALADRRPFLADFTAGMGLMKTIGVVGRLTPLKGHEVLIQAIQILRNQNKPCTCVIVGDGEGRQDLEQLALASETGNSFHFLGYQGNVFSIIKDFDICVLPSYQDSCPNALLEYMAMGKPVVASNVPGINEIIAHGQNGLLFPVGDAASLAKNIAYLIDHPDAASGLGAAGQQRLREAFSMSTTASQYEAFYRRMLGKVVRV